MTQQVNGRATDASTSAEAPHAVSGGSKAAAIVIGDALSHWIDLFRWTAAFAVVLAHAANRFVQPVDTIPTSEKTLVQYGYAFVMGFSHPGIMIFFVISGFLVGGTAYREVTRTGGIDVPRFLGRRLIRLWIVIIPALAATWLFDTVGAAQGGVSAEIYSNVKSLGAGAAVCNLAFLQTVACDPYGTNGALWTLFNEFWYYFLYVAGLMLILGRRYSAATRIALAAFILVVAIASLFQREGAPMIPYFSIWLLGAWAAVVPHAPTRASPWLLLITLTALLGGFRTGMGLKWWNHDGVGSFVFDLVSMGVFALFLAKMRFDPVPLTRWIAVPSVLLASFSFTVYCFHVPLMNLMAALGERHAGEGWRDVAHGVEWLRLAAQLSFVMTFAYLMSRVTEARTDALRRVLMGR
jgi:peptidoglycan/LPS O-acetylase OafA/YrhL